MAAGNCCIIKPSDLSVNTSQFMADVLPKYIDNECYPVFLGGIPETTDLLKERYLNNIMEIAFGFSTLL